MSAFRPGATRSLPDRDLDRLAERYGALLVVRLGIAMTVLVVATFARSVIGIGFALVAPVTGAYLVFAVLAEVARRRGKWGIDIQSVMQLVDVAYIALIMAPTGGPRSQLVFLLYVHLIAVTLLGNHRTGLRMALIDSLVFILLYTFSLNNQVGRLLGAPVTAASQPSAREVALSILAFWLVASCTAFYSWVNERELRRSKEELGGLAELSRALERTRCPEDIAEVLLTRSVGAFRFPRGAILLSQPDGTTLAQTVPGGPKDVAGRDAGPPRRRGGRAGVGRTRTGVGRGRSTQSSTPPSTASCPRPATSSSCPSPPKASRWVPWPSSGAGRSGSSCRCGRSPCSTSSRPMPPWRCATPG